LEVVQTMCFLPLPVRSGNKERIVGINITRMVSKCCF
jgi:hypothetical protein